MLLSPEEMGSTSIRGTATEFSIRKREWRERNAKDVDFLSSSPLVLWLAILSPCSCAFPISSFFLQSTEMTDYPLASKALPMRLMCRNWPSRAACNTPSMLFLVALRENVSIPPAYHIPLDTLFQCVSRDGNSMSCTGIQRWLLSFHVGKQVSNKTSSS